MQLIKELLEVSGYRPETGYSRDLMELANAGIDRSEALRRWVSLGRTEGSFYKAYKALKDSLVRLSFLERNDVSELEARRLEVWDKYRTVKQLLILQKKAGAVELAIELVRKARKAGFTEVVVGLASLLENHFGAIDIDNRRYTRYRNLRRTYSLWLQDELDVMSLQARLVNSVKRKSSFSELEGQIQELANKSYGSYAFMRFRFSVLSIWFEMKNDFERVMLAFHETVDFYESCEVDLPTTVLSTLYSRLTFKLVARELYPEAESHISRGLKVIKLGTQSWHRLMLQKACLGLISGKIGMARGCLKKATEVESSHGNPEVDHRWKVVEQLLEGGGEQDFEAVWGAVFG